METASAVSRMSDHERTVARLLADAGIKSVRHLWKIVNAAEEISVDYATVHRYLYNPPRRLDFKVISALSQALGVTPEVFVEAISRGSSTAR